MIINTVMFVDLVPSALLGGFAVFIMSFVLRMVLQYHWTDYAEAPDEERVRDAISGAGIGAGQYVIPYCGGPEKMKDPEWQASYEKGPSGFLVIQQPGPFAFGRALSQSLLFNMAVALLAAWMVVTFLDPSASASTVGLFVGVVGFLSFSASHAWTPIWMSGSWAVFMKELFDGAVYGAAMAGCFFWLWPGGAA